MSGVMSHSFEAMHAAGEAGRGARTTIWDPTICPRYPRRRTTYAVAPRLGSTSEVAPCRRVPLSQRASRPYAAQLRSSFPPNSRSRRSPLPKPGGSDSRWSRTGWRHTRTRHRCRRARRAEPGGARSGNRCGARRRVGDPRTSGRGTRRRVEAHTDRTQSPQPIYRSTRACSRSDLCGSVWARTRDSLAETMFLSVTSPAEESCRLQVPE